MKTPFVNENSLVYTNKEDSESASTHNGCQHGHGHEHKHKKILWYQKKNKETGVKRTFVIVLCVTVFFSFVQLIISYFAGSLSLINDAFHQLVDTSVIIVALIALHLSSKRNNSTYTYGYYRLEVIGAIVCNIVLIGVMCLLVWESIGRIFEIRKKDPSKENNINAGWMMAGAMVSIISSLWIMLLLKSRKDIMKFYKEHDKCFH